MQQYKIKHFSQHMGVSIDTIKHYQKCGILTPSIDPQNNYRYYDMTHGERLIVSRKFRNLGFGLDDTKAMISEKDGPEIKEMLFQRKLDLEAQIAELQNQLDHVTEFSEQCDLFTNHANTYSVCMKPAYFFYRHTCPTSFLYNTKGDPILQSLMNNLPNTFKLKVIPNNEKLLDNNPDYTHCIALKEDCQSKIHDIDFSKLEYSPEKKAVCYLLSRPHDKNHRPDYYQLQSQLRQDGFQFSNDDIYVENAIDFYKNGVRYENYFVYYCLAY